MFWVNVMNRKLYITFSGSHNSIFLPYACAVLFIFGTAAGSLFAREISDIAFLQNILSAAFADSDEVGFRLFIQSFFDNAVWAIAFLCFAFSAFGMIGAAAAALSKGFISSFALCLSIRLLGSQGILFSSLFFALETILIFPFLLVLAVKSFEVSCGVCKLCFFRYTASDEISFKGFLFSFIVFCIMAALFAVVKCYIIYPAAIRLYPI